MKTVEKEEVKLERKQYQLVHLPESHDFSDMTFRKGDGEAVGFHHEETGRIVAYAWYRLGEGMLYMDLIYVLDKEMGHGTRIVQFLFEELNLDSICGSIKRDITLRPYYFWESMGADINVADGEEMEECCREGQDVFFQLKRENLFTT